MTEKEVLAEQLRDLIDAVTAAEMSQVRVHMETLNATIAVLTSSATKVRDRSVIVRAASHYDEFKWLWSVRQRDRALRSLQKAQEALKPDAAGGEK